jgi:hypothetical protein
MDLLGQMHGGRADEQRVSTTASAEPCQVEDRTDRRYLPRHNLESRCDPMNIDINILMILGGMGIPQP